MVLSDYYSIAVCNALQRMTRRPLLVKVYFTDTDTIARIALLTVCAEAEKTTLSSSHNFSVLDAAVNGRTSMQMIWVHY